MPERRCCDCGTPVHACMGSVAASDFLKALAGRLPWTEVRERCGVCVEKERRFYEKRADG